MKSSYERKKYIYSFVWIGLVSIVILAVWQYIAFGGNVLYTVISTVMIAAALVISGIAGYRSIDEVYSEVENISEKMVKVMDSPDVVTEEEFRQGTI